MIEDIFVIGFHHESLTSAERGEILMEKAVNLEEVASEKLLQHGIKAATLLKTCNRIELYGYGEKEGAKELFSEIAKVPKKFQERQIVKQGAEGLHHIFKVASGLDSQLLGDQEILSQFRQSFQESKSYGLLDGFMERLANTSLQAAKEIRKRTKISEGTTSLSYAAMQILKKKRISSDAKILLVGLGKFGASIARNIKRYFPKNALVISNRTLEKSRKLSQEITCSELPLDAVAGKVNAFDVLILAVEMDRYLIHNADYQASKEQIVIDLSVPSALEPTIKFREEIEYFDIEEATIIVNETLTERRASVEPAMEIIDEFMLAFTEWSKKHSQSSVIKKYKEIVEQAGDVCPFFHRISPEEKKSYMQRSVGLFVKHLGNQEKLDDEETIIRSYLNVHV